MDYLLVHGAWHGAWVWDQVGAHLRAQGHRVHVVELASHGAVGTPIGGLYDDADIVRTALTEIGCPVVVVGHSYGGAVITEAVTDAAEVRQLVYLAAFMPEPGQSILDVIGGKPPLWWMPSPNGRTVTVDRPKALFYNDCDDATADAAVARLQPQSLASLVQPTSVAAWREIPSTYIVCLKDGAGSPEVQRAIGSRARRLLEIDSGHTPQLSKPGVLAEVLGSLALEPPDPMASALAEHL